MSSGPLGTHCETTFTDGRITSCFSDAPAGRWERSPRNQTLPPNQSYRPKARPDPRMRIAGPDWTGPEVLLHVCLFSVLLTHWTVRVGFYSEILSHTEEQPKALTEPLR